MQSQPGDAHAVGVGERRRGQHSVLLAEATAGGHRPMRGRHGMEGMHHRLGRRRGARSESQQAGGIGRRLGHRPRRMGEQIVKSQGAGRGVAAHHIDLLQTGNPLPQGGHGGRRVVVPHPAPANHRLDAAVVHQRRQFAFPIGHVQQSRHGPQPVQGMPGDQHFRHIGQLQAHRVAVADAGGGEASGAAQHLVVELGVAELDAWADERRMIGGFRRPFLQPLKGPFVRPGPFFQPAFRVAGGILNALLQIRHDGSLSCRWFSFPLGRD